MFIVVKIHKCRAGGGSVEACAYRAWTLSRLLHDAPHRNRFRYLVALNGQNVEGVFCINGVAPDILPGRVKFDLQPVSQECFAIIQNAIATIYESANLKSAQRPRYITEEHFNQDGIEVPETNCCPLRTIPLLERNQIEDQKRPEIG